MRLVVLDGVAGARLDPVGEPRVQLRARALEDAPVGGVADQDVMEAQHRLAEEPAGVALDQLAAPQRFEPCVEVGDVARQQFGDGAAREMAADDGRALEHHALFRPQSLDARGQQRVDRRRHLERRQRRAGSPAIALALERAFVHQHAHQLADEERIALAGGEHLGRDRRGQIGGADHVGGEPHRGAGVETTERQHVGDQAARNDERRAHVAQLGSRADQHQQRHAAAPLHQVLDEIEQQRLRPLQVVDHQHQRLGPRERGEETADDEEGLFRRCRRTREQQRDAAGDARALGAAARERGLDRRRDLLRARTVAQAEVLAQRVGERRKGGAARRVAMRRHHAGRVAAAARELADQP